MTRGPLQPLAFLDRPLGGNARGPPRRGASAARVRAHSELAVHSGREPERLPAAGKNSKGDVHEDLGLFSFDSTRKRLVFRQFHKEGFVNQYVHDPAQTDKVVFTIEAIENIPVGWRARETYVVHGTDAFEEIFELAEPGKDFEVYSHARFKRAQ